MTQSTQQIEDKLANTAVGATVRFVANSNDSGETFDRVCFSFLCDLETRGDLTILNKLQENVTGHRFVVCVVVKRLR